MLRITADVNGKPIGFLFIHNVGQHRCKTPQCGIWEYHAATWDPFKYEGTFGIEGVLHHREDDWTTLVSLVLRGIK